MIGENNNKPLSGFDIIGDIIDSLIGNIDGTKSIRMYGDVGVDMKMAKFNRVILFPSLIIITTNKTGETRYYAYNNKTYNVFDIKSYSDFYDEVSETTGKELESIFQRTYSQRKRKR